MSDAHETYPYAGRARQVVGRLHYPEDVPPGTLIGTGGWGETLVVLGNETEDGKSVTLIGRATTTDMEMMRARMAVLGPASLFEAGKR